MYNANMGPKLCSIGVAVNRLGVTESMLLRSAAYLGVQPAMTLDDVLYFHTSEIEIIETYLQERNGAVEGSRLNPITPCL